MEKDRLASSAQKGSGKGCISVPLSPAANMSDNHEIHQKISDLRGKKEKKDCATPIGVGRGPEQSPWRQTTADALSRNSRKAVPEKKVCKTRGGAESKETTYMNK